MMGSNFGDLFFVSFDTPEGSNVVSVDEALGFLFFIKGVGYDSPSKQNFGSYIHLSKNK